MRKFTFLLSGAPDDASGSPYRVEVASKRRAYELARQMLGRFGDGASIDILEDDLRLGTVGAGEGG